MQITAYTEQELADLRANYEGVERDPEPTAPATIIARLLTTLAERAATLAEEPAPEAAPPEEKVAKTGTQGAHGKAPA